MLASITCSFTRFKSKIGRYLQKQNNILLLLWAINSFHNKRIFEVLKVLSVFVKYQGFWWILIQIRFQTILNFTGQLKKWPKLKLMVKGKSFDKYHDLFNLQILATISHFHEWDSSILSIKIFMLESKSHQYIK